MAKPRVTGWIKGNVKPALKGIYQRDYRNARDDRDAGITYCYWDGDSWMLYGESPRHAERWDGFRSSYQDLPWRGLAKDPSAATHQPAAHASDKGENDDRT